MQTLYVKYLSPACLDSLSCDQLPEWNHKYERKHKADIKYIISSSCPVNYVYSFLLAEQPPARDTVLS